MGSPVGLLKSMCLCSCIPDMFQGSYALMVHKRTPACFCFRCYCHDIAFRNKQRVRLCELRDNTPEDEYNLVYVAATRAKLALVCNKDVQKLLEEADERPAVVKVTVNKRSFDETVHNWSTSCLQTEVRVWFSA